VRTAQSLADGSGSPLHANINRRQGFRAPGHRQIGQIDVDRQAGHVADEQVDRRAALQREVPFRFAPRTSSIVATKSERLPRCVLR